MNGKLKVLSFGAGAVSTYISGSLALAGHPVVFVARQKTVEEIREKGIRQDLT
jgi:ketopantoate reductase